ncbi:hypothetical protein EDD21DRAFT_15941 [Dissophora ornata]|nr:hypothetical protein EDD21DRAFT_15941 [Dissophora ornata]
MVPTLMLLLLLLLLLLSCSTLFWTSHPSRTQAGNDLRDSARRQNSSPPHSSTRTHQRELTTASGGSAKSKKQRSEKDCKKKFCDDHYQHEILLYDVNANKVFLFFDQVMFKRTVTKYFKQDQCKSVKTVVALDAEKRSSREINLADRYVQDKLPLIDRESSLG